MPNNGVIWLRARVKSWHPIDPIELSVSPAPLSYCCSPRQTNGVAHALTVRAVSVKTLFHHVFCTILDTEGHQMGNKYSMEGFIKYLKINTVGNSKRGFTDHNASGRRLILRSVCQGWGWRDEARTQTNKLKLPRRGKTGQLARLDKTGQGRNRIHPG